MDTSSRDKVIFIGIISTMILGIIFSVIFVFTNIKKEHEENLNKNASELMQDVNVTKATPHKGQITMEGSNLYDELPEIDKYPLAISGNNDIDIEIFTSGEKAGSNNDAWLIDCAKNFNNAGYTTESGKSISISVRSVSSGLAADYIISSKYLPDLYTPSNTLFGEYAIVNNGNLELYTERLVGNTAGLLIKKGSSYKNIDDILKAVIDGKLNIGYTNPQTSATGMNLLIHILKTYGNDNINNEAAINAFSTFNNNIPFVAYTTQQMATSANNGTLDGMVTEYQAYINDKNLQSMYDFIPFGMRHDNPLYIINKNAKTNDELAAIEIVTKYLTNDDSQKLASKYGFNAHNDYKGESAATGAEITSALQIYKDHKDAGKEIIAVFVADCSGSMDGDPMIQLKESLINGMNYINSNNYIGLVSYSNDVTIELPIAKFDMNQKAYFKGAIDNLNANGGTASYDAIVVAEAMIDEMKTDHPDAKFMIFLLSDGAANQGYGINTITPMLQRAKTPIYTICYGSGGDADAMKELSNINEAATINADSDDIVYKIKSLFNSQM